MSPERIRITALHEAAHFVAAYVKERNDDIHGITIVTEGRFAGSVGGQSPNVDFPDEVEDALLGLYAGRAASLYADPDDEEGALESAEADDMMAAALMPWLDRPPAEAEAELRASAAALVAENWHLIEALAADLLVEKTIDGEEATLVVQAAKGESWAPEELRSYRKIKRASQPLGPDER